MNPNLNVAHLAIPHLEPFPFPFRLSSPPFLKALLHVRHNYFQPPYRTRTDLSKKHPTQLAIMTRGNQV